ncbi:hypothetical protein KSP39_PZI002682 [Platanthera zijinensis]|uniref:Uncharacterized protein n=1 Tax=Platanthera zijinensis TaxID=2320716 RepID=A0AAP0C1N5_9ASPA
MERKASDQRGESAERLEEYWKKKAEFYPLIPARRKGWRLRRRKHQAYLGGGGEGPRVRCKRRVKIWILVLLRSHRTVVRALGKLGDSICSALVGETLVKELQRKSMDPKDLRSRVTGELAAAAACI